MSTGKARTATLLLVVPEVPNLVPYAKIAPGDFSVQTWNSLVSLGHRFLRQRIAYPLIVAADIPLDNSGAPALLMYELARREGRNIPPPHFCPVHQIATYGGCCG